MPGVPSIRWRARDVAALKAAVRAFNRAVTVMRKRYGDDVELPYKTTYEDERSRISTRKEFNQAMKSLGNILVKNKPGAQELVTDSRGVQTVRYVVDENRRLARLRKLQSKARLKRQYPGYDGLTPPEQAALISDGDYDFSGVPRVGARGLEEARKAVGSKTAEYVERYLDVWEQNGGSPDVAFYVRELEAKYPSELENIFQSRYDEAYIEYIYPSDKSSYAATLAYRQTKVEQFWSRMYSAVVNGDYWGGEIPQANEVVEGSDD